MDAPRPLPPRDEMVAAMLACDAAYEGVFITAVRTTGIFCRPTCTARKPLPRNVDFYAGTAEAAAAGFRPCLRCRPLDAPERTPDWIAPLLEAIEQAPHRPWTQADVRALGLAPERVRTWFRQHRGSTFSAYVRARRLGVALDRLQDGARLDDAAADGGYASLSGFRDAFRKRYGTTPGRAARPRQARHRMIDTPLGPMLALAEDRGLVLLEFTDRPALPRELHELESRHGYAARTGTHPHLGAVERELSAYFAGGLETFSVPLHAPGSEFDRTVWDALRGVPFGQTTTYGALARDIGRPTAVRAVAAANGRNRLAILIPCHRVIGRDGQLVGYGGGMPRKARLLALERAVRDRREDAPGHQPALC
ncbi:MAG TPA: methylated-DNA--[protein]-cysteine S-methyltransferase [Lysobacter sp.]|nr:methylated-DNA--[protein]-cysteine S-methyltransferase [Lysobacter sp.]